MSTSRLKQLTFVPNDALTLGSHLAESEKVVQITETKAISSRGQFGISMEGQIVGKGPWAEAKQNEAVFIKLPADSADERQLEQGRRNFRQEFQKRDHLHYIQIISQSEVQGEAKFSVAQPLALGEIEDPDTKRKLPALLYELVMGKDLTKLTGEPDFLLRTTEPFLEFARGLARLVQRIHNNSLVHSFIVPRHIIKNEPMPATNDSSHPAEKVKANITTGRALAINTSGMDYSLVGFGYSHYCDAAPAERLYTAAEDDKPFLAPEVRQKQSFGALWYPADIYSIGAILYWRVVGTPPLVDLPPDVSRLKHLVHVDVARAVKGIWTEKGLNENIVKILDRCLRHDPEDRFSCVEELIEALDIVALSNGKRMDTTTKEEVANETKRASSTEGVKARARGTQKPIVAGHLRSIAKWDRSNALAGFLSDKLNPLFDGMIEGFAQSACQQAEQISRGHYEIYGHRDHLVNSLCRLLALAKKHSIYRTWTLPGYWSDANLGSSGRFLTMNKHMARMGVRIQRIFLVAYPFAQLSEQEQDILEAHQRALDDLTEKSASGEQGFQVRVLLLDGSVNSSFTDMKHVSAEAAKLAVDEFETQNHPVAYLATGRPGQASADVTDPPVFLNFISQGREVFISGRRVILRSIKKARFWEARKSLSGQYPEFKRIERNFLYDWDIAIPLETYLGGKGKNLKLKDTLEKANALLKPAVLTES